MELSSRYVGTRSEPFEVALSPRQTMNYAASIDDANPWYFDDERPEGILAPPMLSVGLTWPISSPGSSFWRAEDFPREVLTRQVHYSECIRWRRAMKPGDRLRIEGEVKAILPHRAGTQLIIAYDAVDDNGELVFTEYIGGMLREVTCVDGGAGGDAVPKITRRRRGDDVLWEERLVVDPLASFVYDGCTNMFFPIHSSPSFAHGVGLPGILYQGTATLSLAVRELTNREAGGDPRRVEEVRCLFTGMVFPGDEITVRADGKKNGSGSTQIDFTVLNAQGRPAIRSGRITLKNE